MKMVLNKLKPYMLAASIGLAGLLGMNTAKAEEPTRIEQILKGTKAPENPAELLTPKPTKKEDIPAYKNGLEWLIVGSELGASVFAATAVHETGHIITATALGDTVYDVKLYPHKVGGRWFMGRVIIDYSDSKAKNIAIASGGMIATRLTAEAIDGFMNYAENHPKGDLHPRAKQALAALYFMNRFEGPKYIIRSAIPCWLGKPEYSGDPSGILANVLGPKQKKMNEQGKLVGPKPTMEEKAIYAGATALLILDTIADWDEIKDNWNRLWLMPTEKKQKSYDLSVDFTESGVHGNFTYNF